VAMPSGSEAEAADMPLARLNQPWDHGCTQVWPASFGEGQTKAQDNLGKFRCRVVVNHGPFSCFCELVSQPFVSENGPFFLNTVSLFNL
jgi:hypothetical protein